MKLKTTTQDFTPKLKSFLKGYFSLRESGIQNVNIDLDPLLDGFLYQFEEPVPDRNSCIPLPPDFSAKNDSRMPAAWVAKSKINNGTLPSTVAAYSVDAERLLIQKVAQNTREEYEIVPLYPHD